MTRLLLVLALLALAGCGSPPSRGELVLPTPSPVPQRQLPRLVPASVNISRISAQSTLIPLGLNPDGSLATPEVTHPGQAGYYCVTDPTTLCSSGVLPGQPGPAVIIGHVDGAKQQGVFYRLPELVVGDTAVVTELDGSVLTFMAYRVLKTPKAMRFPVQAVYGDTVGPELRLITCTGPFAGGKIGYSDNFIVFMQLVPNVPS